MPKYVGVIDVSDSRRRQIAALVRRCGGEPIDLGQHDAPPGVPVLGHRRDVVEPKEVKADLMVLYSGSSFTVEGPGRYRFPRLIDHDRSIDANTEEDLALVIRWLLEGGSVPALLCPSKELLAPLIPLGILIDGYLALAEQGRPIERGWFEPAVATAHRVGQPGGTTVDDRGFWMKLATDAEAIRQLGRILEDPEAGTRESRELVAAARKRWQGDAGAVSSEMVDTLHGFWHKLTCDPGSIARADVEGAQLAYQLLAAVHL